MSRIANNPRDQRFPGACRLKRSAEFERVRREGRRRNGRLLSVGILRVPEEPEFRVGFVTSRRVGSAVVRNRVRRRLREIVRRDQRRLEKGVWLVVIARPAAAQAEYRALEREWRNLV